jgi:uncharacterized protein (TIGR00251 family)
MTRSALLEITANPERSTVQFAVRVQPGASQDQIAGEMEGALKIRLQARAIENRANEELCVFLAGLLKRPKSAVRILAGQRSRCKRVEISGVSAEQVAQLLQHQA